MKYLLCVLLLTVASAEVKAQNLSPEQKLKERGIVLPEIAPPSANFVDIVRSGNLLFLAGKGSKNPDGSRITGKIGVDLTVEQGYLAAQSIAIQHIAVIKKEIGDLSKVVRFVKVLGMANTNADFTAHSQVINGYSDFIVDIFGDKGKHARSAVGMNSLPVNLAVEIEVIVEVK